MLALACICVRCRWIITAPRLPPLFPLAPSPSGGSPGNFPPYLHCPRVWPLLSCARSTQELQGQGASARVVGAFVTFKREEGKASALRALPRSFMRKLLLRPEHKLRGAHALHVSDAPEPSDVKASACGRLGGRAPTRTGGLLPVIMPACDDACPLYTPPNRCTPYPPYPHPTTHTV